MASPNSMFLFEITVEELNSLISCREFCITTQFANIFSVRLKDPNEWGTYIRSMPVKSNRKTRIRNGRPKTPKLQPTTKVRTGQSILHTNTTEALITSMKEYPMELALWSKLIPDYKLGSTQIPWDNIFIEYLKKLPKGKEPQATCVAEHYNVFDEITSKRMAIIKLNIKLTYLTDVIPNNPDPDRLFLENENSQKESISLPVALPDAATVIEDELTKVACSKIHELQSVSRNIEKVSHSKNETSVHELFTTECVDNVEKSRRHSEVIELHPPHNKGNPQYDTGNDTKSIVSLVKSDLNLTKIRTVDITKSKSCSSIDKEHLKVLNYIFGNEIGPLRHQVYTVGYFTVTNDNDANSPTTDSKSASSPKPSSPKSPGSTKSGDGIVANSERSEGTSKFEVRENDKIKFVECKLDCPHKSLNPRLCTRSVCSLHLPIDAPNLVTIKECDHIKCNRKTYRQLPPPPDPRILIELTGTNDKSCEVTEKVEEVVGGMTATMKVADDPCYCECECRFGFYKKTTYCKVCGGYEVIGEESMKVPPCDMPYPCPIYHKLADKPKPKTVSTTGSDSKKKESKQKSAAGAAAGAGSEQKKIAVTPEKSIESVKDTSSAAARKKRQKKKSTDKFKFNYGYTGIPPMIGHAECASPCTGTLGLVPKGMGWLWTATDIPGLKFRPSYKPGAANKHVVRLLRIAKNPGEIKAKKRKRDSGKPKRPLKRPLLTVHKKDGEYTVTMETMKTYTKPRMFNQHPFEDKPLVTYTIGRTDEENRERKIRKERARRRLERLQREFIQSAFRDMCEEICLKTYQQALGILPDTEHPDCPCYPAEPGADRTDLDHSCSCSEDKSLSETETDSDEWLVEFTPPNATFDPTFKGKRVVTNEVSTQYNFMDYRVKLLDRYGNPVPRFFKGPDGKQQCSDLGGFWGPNGKWLEINVDGYIGPDERWAPNVFTGPNGEQVEAEGGKFQALDGKWLVVGVDGYIDPQGKWKFYKSERERRVTVQTKKRIPKEEKHEVKKSEATWSCFGDASPKQLSKMGIIGHGHNKKILLTALQGMLAQGEDVKIPQPSTVPRSGKKPKKHYKPIYESADKMKCKHAVPSDKGIVAVDGHGHKTYFRLKDYKNKRPKQRVAALSHQGISVSSFHMPCFHSFISNEIMKKQQYERLVALSKGAKANHKCTATSHEHIGSDSAKHQYYPSVLV